MDKIDQQLAYDEAVTALKQNRGKLLADSIEQLGKRDNWKYSERFIKDESNVTKKFDVLFSNEMRKLNKNTESNIRKRNAKYK